MVPTAGPNGRLGNATSSTISANLARTFTDSSKFFFTSGCTLAIAPLRMPILNLGAFSLIGSGYVNGLATVVGSSGSVPARADSTRPQSSAHRHMGPSLSSVQQSAIAPCRLTRPYVGRRPESPQFVDGVMMEPEVSEPMAKATRPAAVEAPAPLELPPLQ